MKNDKELNALFKLLDDPDVEIFTAVENKILSYGPKVLPHLENFYETHVSADIYNRLVHIKHQFNHQSIIKEFENWVLHQSNDLLTGLLIFSRYEFDDVQTTEILSALEKIRKSFWLELNFYQTPIEQINILRTILFDHQRLELASLKIENLSEYFVNHLLKLRKGNVISFWVLITVLCDMVDVPVKPVYFNGILALGYFKTINNENENREELVFFIEPSHCNIANKKEMESHLQSTDKNLLKTNFSALNNLQFIRVIISLYIFGLEQESDSIKKRKYISVA